MHGNKPLGMLSRAKGKDRVMRYAMLLAILAISTLGASQVQAATKTFDGGPSGSGADFSVAANWSGDTLPVAGDELLFNGTSSATFITNVSGTYQRIFVSRPAGSQALTFNLSGNLTLTGTAGTSIFIDTGEGATFQGTGGTRIVQCNDDVQLEGSLSQCVFLPSATLLFQTGTPALLLKAGSVLTMSGLLDIRLASTLGMENGASATLNNVDLAGFLTLDDLSGTPSVSLNGTVRATGAGAAFYANAVASMNVGFNNCTFNRNGQSNFEIDFDGSTNNVAGNALVSIGGGGGSWLTPPAFGNTTITTLGSLSFSPGVGVIEFVRTLNIAGDLDLGSNPVNFYSNITLQTGGTFTGGTVPGVVTLVNASAATQNITGVWSFGAQLLVQDGHWRVATGSSVTVAGSFWLQADTFGAAEDGVTASGRATITFNGNVRVDASDSYIIGEGTHNFAANIDFGFTAAIGDCTVAPLSTNNEAAQINLTGGAVTVNFGVSGTLFFVSSVAANTRVTSSGDWTLRGDFNLAAATGGSTAPAWNAPGSQVIVDGLGLRTVTLGDRDLVTFRFRVGTSGAVTGTDRVELVFTKAAPATGVLTTSFLVFGDTVDTVAGSEDNGAVVRLNNMNTVVASSTLYGGDSTLGGQGPLLEVNGGALTINNYLSSTGIANTTESHAGARFSFVGATVTFTGGSRALSLTAFVSAAVSSTTFGSTGGGWEMTSPVNAASISLNGCTLGATGGTVLLTLGGANLSFVNTVFGNGNSNGLQVVAGSTLGVLSGCTFQNGTLNGSHITLNGLANVARLNCPNNQFDNSVNVSVAGGGYLVSATGNNPLTFQAAAADDFGLGAYTISAFTAEVDGDTDGVMATEVQWQFTGGGGSGGGGDSGGDDGGCSTGTELTLGWLALLAALCGYALRRRLAR